MKVYNKLIRDRIPEIIKESGKKCEVEIADVMEVLFAIDKKYRYSEDEVLEVRNNKKSARGGFENNIIKKC